MRRVVVTGLGVVSALGTGREAHMEGLREGRSGIAPISLIDPERLMVKSAAEAKPFRGEDLFERPQLAPFDRVTEMASSCAREAVAQAGVSGQTQRGIRVGGSGVGAGIAANKGPGVRACLCHDTYSARQGVEHDDMNVLCLGARVVGAELARELVAAFLKARFTGEERHRRRLGKVLAIERRALQEGADRTAGGLV